MANVGITPQQFAQLQHRLGGTKRVATPLVPTPMGTSTPRHRVILGIDPSLRGTGFGIIRLAKPHPQTLDQGTLRCPAGWPRSRCLVNIAQGLRDTIRKHQPTVCAIEGLFYAQNLQTALIMGEARGVCLMVAAEAGLEVFEIATRKVKQAIVGYGAAQKLAVAKMVQRMLQLSEPPASDAADALALALTYAQENRGFSVSLLKKI